jgi:hypothetical protein
MERGAWIMLWKVEIADSISDLSSLHWVDIKLKPLEV